MHNVERLEEARKRRNGARKQAGLRRFARGDHAELGDSLLDELSQERGHIVSTEGAIYVYRPGTGVWERQPMERLHRIIKSFAGAPKGQEGVLKVSAGALDGAIRMASAEVHAADFFDRIPHAVGFADGALSIDSDGAIRRHAQMPDNRLRHAFPFAYDPAADRARFERFLLEVFADADDKLERIALLQEFIGACLVGFASTYEQCLICYGTGGNGKSEFMRIIAALFPTHAAVPPQQWAERFAIAALAGALVNIVDEMPESEFIESNRFKQIVSGKLKLQAEQKFQDPFTFTPRAGHIFAANRLPGSGDVTEGFWRRFIICLFTRTFSGSEKRVDAGLAVLEHELPGVATWAVEGAARLIRQGSYTVPPSHHAAMATWRTAADSVAGYIDEKCWRLRPDEDIEQGTRSALLYSGYRDWALKSGYKPVSSKTFAARMDGLGLFGVRRSSGVFFPVRIVFDVASVGT